MRLSPLQVCRESARDVSSLCLLPSPVRNHLCHHLLYRPPSPARRPAGGGHVRGGDAVARGGGVAPRRLHADGALRLPPGTGGRHHAGAAGMRGRPRGARACVVRDAAVRGGRAVPPAARPCRLDLQPAWRAPQDHHGVVTSCAGTTAPA